MHTKQTRGAAGHATLTMPKLSPAATPARIDNIRNDFIPHPAQFPLRYRRRPSLPWSTRATTAAGGDVGLSFHSEKYIPAGTRLELEIPLRGHVQRFVAKVVMVRELNAGFEIGLWFTTSDDAVRARIVEKICHTECYLQARHTVRN